MVAKPTTVAQPVLNLAFIRKAKLRPSETTMIAPRQATSSYGYCKQKQKYIFLDVTNIVKGKEFKYVNSKW